MTKQEFLNELSAALACLSEAERKDILRDMDEYFREAMSRGRTEAEIAQQLGSPKTLSETIIAEAKVNRITTADSFSKRLSAVFAALFAILLLTPFNLIFVLLPLLLVTLLLGISWPIVLIIAISLPLVLFGSFFAAFHVGLNLFALFAILFFAMGWVGMIVAIIVGFSYLSVLYFKGIARLFLWNIQFIKNRMKDQA